MDGMLPRNIFVQTWQELAQEKSMIFLSGPRQSGKTTLAKIIASSFTNSLYFNWDIPEHRTRFLRDHRFFEGVERKDATAPLIIFDELHKYRDWKNALKGIYDEFHDAYRFLVTGSGRLDIYQKGGDSLAGRYLPFHLFPLTVAELGGRRRAFEEFRRAPLQITMEGAGEAQAIWDQLAELSGFPEPYLSGRKTTWRRWSQIYARQLIREDIRDLAGIKSVQDLETLYLLLPTRVGSTLSVPSLCGDLKASYNTVRSWLDVFERFYLTFGISTWTARIARAIQKEKKIYLWDYPQIQDAAARFENMVAAELQRAVVLWNDLGYGRFSLHFIRDKEKREVDFLIAAEGAPFLLVEAKLGDAVPAKALRLFQEQLGLPAVQLTGGGDSYHLFTSGKHPLLIAPAAAWLSHLP
ncbi:ATP-binding protein [Candidatus Dependentiae bacterium]|nr:ATP-binding protein [Candidatus Dependentiae bacterium]